MIPWLTIWNFQNRRLPARLFFMPNQIMCMVTEAGYYRQDFSVRFFTFPGRVLANEYSDCSDTCEVFCVLIVAACLDTCSSFPSMKPDFLSLQAARNGFCADIARLER